MNKKLSLIIPIKNEAAALSALFARLFSILKHCTIDYEIVTVNDGSTDETLALLLEEQKKFSQIKIVDLTRNFGKEAALYAGFEHAKGDCAIAIDADLQDPPELILEMVNWWLEGYEVVRAVRESRETDSFFKRKTANWFYSLMNKISEIKLTHHAGDYILLDRQAINAFLRLKEKVRFNKGLLSWIGFKEKLVYHKREARVAGQTKWNYYKLLKFSIDGITSFSKAPLEIWIFLGVLCSLSAFGYGIFYFIKTLIFGIELHGYPSLLIFILFFSGLQMIGIGILGNYIGRIFIETKERPIYIVRKFHE